MATELALPKSEMPRMANKIIFDSSSNHLFIKFDSIVIYSCTKSYITNKQKLGNPFHKEIFMGDLLF